MPVRSARSWLLQLRFAGLVYGAYRVRKIAGVAERLSTDIVRMNKDL